MITPSGSFTRVADMNAYASGDLVAQSTTAGSCSAVALRMKPRTADGTTTIRRVRLKKSGTTITNASFRVHFYDTNPTSSIANGDNAAWSTNYSGYLGSVDVTLDKAFVDSSSGIGVPNTGTEIGFVLKPGVATAGEEIFFLLEARAAYAPASAEVFTVTAEIYAA